MMLRLDLNNPADLLSVAIVFALLCVVALFLILTMHRSADAKEEEQFPSGKSSANNPEDAEDENTLFETIEEYEEFDVIYCTVTKVMYAVSTDYYNSGTMTVLVNADGTPMLYRAEDYPTRTH